MEFTAATIASILGGEVEGDAEAKVSSFAKIEEGHDGALSFMANPKYEHYVYETKSTVVIVGSDFHPREKIRTTLIRVADPYGCFAKLLKAYADAKPRKTGISPKAAIDDSATIGENCYIGHFAVVEAGAVLGNNVQIYPGTYVGDNVTIGDNTILYAGVKVYEGCRIGSDTIIHAGAVIGADGFGFAPDAETGTYSKIPQIGNVVIEDHVEIGANTCIDRATMGSTRIGSGVKLDNLNQIGHNVVVGENTVCAAQAGIAGTSKIGNHCMIGGQTGIAGHLNIGDNVNIGSKSGVSNSISAGETYFGYPAIPIAKHHRSHAIFRNLPELAKKVRDIEKRINETESGCDK